MTWIGWSELYLGIGAVLSIILLIAMVGRVKLVEVPGQSLRCLLSGLLWPLAIYGLLGYYVYLPLRNAWEDRRIRRENQRLREARKRLYRP